MMEYAAGGDLMMTPLSRQSHVCFVMEYAAGGDLLMTPPPLSAESRVFCDGVRGRR